MKILIVDDEHLARQRIMDMLSDLNSESILLQASNGLQALDVVEQEKPDIVLMDIRMPVMDGLEAAFHLTTLTPAPAVIFITAYDEHAIKAFEANAIDYLLKPVRKERLQQALDKACEITRTRLDNFREQEDGSSSRTHLSISSQGKIQLIPVNEISCFKADQKYVTVYWGAKQTLTDESLKALENEFSDVFVRIHRNALVAISFIETLEKNNEGGYITSLKGLEEDFAVSRRHIAEVKKKLKSLK